MRGTHGRRRIHVRRNGIIPAYAGNTPRLSNGGMEQRDHPRVCGEHYTAKGNDGRNLGSSPRMRGTRCITWSPLGSAGIIPAYAGNTWSLHQSKTGLRDHPRVCGEHVRQYGRMHIERGSSPRMRGTQMVDTTCTKSPRDHPRVCGEHIIELFAQLIHMGSSPRMRGTPTSSKTQSESNGIIPAYAGNTTCGRASSTISKDHPRVCGEHQDVSNLAQWKAGIIPAYAGNTPNGGSRRMRQWDHPRVCGEHTSTSTIFRCH